MSNLFQLLPITHNSVKNNNQQNDRLHSLTYFNKNSTSYP